MTKKGKLITIIVSSVLAVLLIALSFIKYGAVMSTYLGSTAMIVTVTIIVIIRKVVILIKNKKRHCLFF